ncbi:MAG: hypothetical protein IPN57_07960 [Ignavibacteria bacterium]|nr:hypothetical protein [Ignavibacteria bacterium]
MDIDDPEKKINIMNSSEESETFINERFIKSWINKFKKAYEQDKWLENALILVLFGRNNTRKNKRISKFKKLKKYPSQLLITE